MRSIDEPLSNSQLELGDICEALLTSAEWQRQNVNYGGTVRRLELIQEVGLPPMRVLPASTLESLGRIPRSDEGYQVDALEAVRQNGSGLLNGAKAVLMFYSHRWARPSWCPALQKEAAWGSKEHADATAAGHAVGDVDFADHRKAKALIEFSAWFKPGSHRGGKIACFTPGE